MSYRVKVFASKIRKYILNFFGWVLVLPQTLFLRKRLKKLFPDLLIIGIAKSGTWWLSHNLNAHPDIFLGKYPGSRRDEVHFFTREFHKSLIWYLNIFSDSGDKFKFEKSPSYCYISSLKIRLIKFINPEIKIILMLREPIERGFSHAKMDLLRSKGRKINDVPFSHFERHYIRHSHQINYSRIISKWRRVFGSNMLILFDKDMSERPSDLLKYVFRFLKLEIILNKELYETKKNITSIVDMPEHHRVLLAQMNKDNILCYKKELEYNAIDS